MNEIGEQFAPMDFPLAGLDISVPFERQYPRPLPWGAYGRTCRSGVNVRGYESQNRARGGARPGIAKYLSSPVVSGWIIQCLQVLTVRPGSTATVQLSSSGRVVALVAVSQGNVYTAVPGATSWTAATNNTGDTPPLNYSGAVYSTALNQKVWFADGTNWVVFDPATNIVSRWNASAGNLPVDSGGNAPRHICSWRGRMVLAGNMQDPQNWFMSKVGDPTDFNYGDPAIPPTMAVAGSSSPLGLVGDSITALVPYNDDVLLLGGDHTIWMLNGDPMAGGTISLVSDSIGMAWGTPWCKDPYGSIFFMSNRTGIYRLSPTRIQGVSAAPVRISQAIEQLLQPIDTGANSIKMVWNDRYQGFHIFITPTSAPAAATHYFYESRTGAWWQDTFANNNHNPCTVAVFDGNNIDDRAALIGSWDGYVRSLSTNASDDDGTPIQSSVLIGPVTSKNLDDFLLKDLQAILGETSGKVTYKVYIGTTAEKAISNPPVKTGTWSKPGRNLTSLTRHAGHAIYVQLSSTEDWAIEAVRARLVGQGRVRRRGA